MKENKSIRISMADAKGFERQSFSTYTLDEEHGVRVVVATDSADNIRKAQTFTFDMEKNPAWDFAKAQAYAVASLEAVNKLAAATKGSGTFKTLAQAANAGYQIPLKTVRAGLRLASLDPEVAKLLADKQLGKAAEIDFDKISAAVPSF